MKLLLELGTTYAEFYGMTDWIFIGYNEVSISVAQPQYLSIARKVRPARMI